MHRAKKLEKSHDPLALVAHKGSSSRTTSPYYVTYPSLVVDYDDDYEGDEIQNTSEDPLTCAMILLARAITQRFYNPTNNRLPTSSNTKNQAIVQGDRVNIQNRNSGNDGRNTRRLYVQEEIIEGTAANVQCYSCSEKGHYARNCPKLRGQAMILHFLVRYKHHPPIINNKIGDEARAKKNEDKQKQKYPKQPKIINNKIGDDQIDSNIIFDEPNKDVNSGSVEYDNNVQESYELEQLARNAFNEAKKQQIISKKVQQQNTVLTK
ncbi:retrovirus-related pol polyprotein from transposon TNT 1-94 [Tanacetum coccineum]